jgi:putative addiction module component (TIGR02574 family)
MSTTSTYLAEEALALPAAQRAGLAQLLIDSLEGDKRSDAEIRAMLESRLQALRSGKDGGMSFEEVFGEKP